MDFIVEDLGCTLQGEFSSPFDHYHFDDACQSGKRALVEGRRLWPLESFQSSSARGEFGRFRFA